MASQDEVFQAAKALNNWITFPRLKKYFNMEHLSGNSHLSARVKVLEKDGKLIKFKFVGLTAYFVPPEFYDITLAHEFKALIRVPRGPYGFKAGILERINNALYGELQTAYMVAKRAGVQLDTARRYLEHLVEGGIIFKGKIQDRTYYSLYGGLFN